MPDKWITTSPSSGKGKHILLGEGGIIKGGGIPKSARGKNIREWAAEISAPRNIARQEGESDEEYQKRARKERRILREQEKEQETKKEEETKKEAKINTKAKNPGESDEDYKKRRQKERREARKELLKSLKEESVPEQEIKKKEEKKEEQEPGTINISDEKVEEIATSLYWQYGRSLTGVEGRDLSSIRNQINQHLASQGINTTPKGEGAQLEYFDPANQDNDFVRDSVKAINDKIKVITEGFPEHWTQAIKDSGYKIAMGLVRSSINVDRKLINLGPDTSHEIVAHELAHIVERQIGEKEMYRKNMEFIQKRRRAGEKIRPLGPPYGREEVAIFDRFTHPYMGKIYPGQLGCTEVLSMGMSVLYNPYMFEKVIKRDREFLKHIIKMMSMR